MLRALPRLQSTSAIARLVDIVFAFRAGQEPAGPATTRGVMIRRYDAAAALRRVFKLIYERE